MLLEPEKKNKKQRPKVYVGLSGGVDSSVSAAILKASGFDVYGVFIKTWQPEWLPCTWKEERRSAMRAAAWLDIPFMTLDLEKEYKKGVVDYMISEYSAGRTPNPDVMCNKEVKFGAFLKWAKESPQNADFIATGHYAQIFHSKTGIPILATGEDETKDQSYFLWTLHTEQLRSVLFPIGHLKKSTVRKYARSIGLPNAKKKDSQGLCFMGKVDMKEFLAKYITCKQGNVLDSNGRIIGKHEGALLYTIGERHGFMVQKNHLDKEDELPMFVIAKDVKNNTLTVSRTNPNFADASSSNVATSIKINAHNINQSFTINAGKKVFIKTRYRQKDILAEIKEINKDSIVLVLQGGGYAATEGQSVVIYDYDNPALVIGGGIIAV